MFHLEWLQLALNIHISLEIRTFGSITFVLHFGRNNGLIEIVAVGLRIFVFVLKSLHLDSAMRVTLKAVAMG